MIRYAFKDTAVLRSKETDAQKCGEALAKIAARNNGQLEVDDVLAEVRGNKRHPLFGEYEWDVDRAAEAHWKHRTRQLISYIFVTDSGNRPPKPAYYSIAMQGRAYHTIASIDASASLQRALLEGANRELAAFARRYTRMGNVCAHVKKAMDEIEVMLAQIVEPAE